MATQTAEFTLNRGTKDAEGKAIKTKIPVEMNVGTTIEEYVAKAGSSDALVRFLQKAEIQANKSALNLIVKAKDNKNVADDVLIQRLQSAAPNLNAFSDSGPSKAEKLSFADAAFALAGDPSISEEERAAKMLELIQKARG